MPGAAHPPLLCELSSAAARAKSITADSYDRFCYGVRVHSSQRCIAWLPFQKAFFDRAGVPEPADMGKRASKPPAEPKKVAKRSNSEAWQDPIQELSPHVKMFREWLPLSSTKCRSNMFVSAPWEGLNASSVPFGSHAGNIWHDYQFSVASYSSYPL